MKKKVITIALILILSFSFALTTLPSVKAAAHTDITVAQAYAMIYDNSYPNLVVMDVRTASDYNAGHIPGAINVPVLPPSPFDFTALNAWINSTEGQSHKNHEIIIYCASGTRSNLAANMLDSNNFTKVYDMRGAYPAWTTAGYPTIIFSNGFEDNFNSWTATNGGASIVTSPVYFGNYSMKCSDPWGSQATKTIATQSKTYTEAQFYFDQNFAGSQTLIAYFNANGNPTVEMGLSVQSGRLFAFVQIILPSYSYSQYELASLFPETWNRFALEASATSATIYLDDQQLATTSQANIPATSSVSVGMFWGNGAYTGNLYIDDVKIGTSAPQSTSASVFSNGFEDNFNSWTSSSGGVSIVSSPVYSGNSSMKCSDPWGSQATKSIGLQGDFCTEAEFYFDQNFAGSQALIAYFNANGNPTVSMGISVQSGRVFAFVETKLPSYSYSQYELTGITPGTWYKFALDASATSATIYLYNQKLVSISQTNIPNTASVRVGMFWGDGSYTGNLYIDNVQIGILPARERPGVNQIDYYNAGGKAEIPLLPTLPTNYPASATNMRLQFIHVEDPNAGTSVDTLVVMYYLILTGQTEHTWQPLAYVTTSAEEAAFAKILWRGSLIEFDATTKGLPASFSTDNVKLVSEGVLTVEKHGNSVNVNLNAPQQIKRPTGSSVYFTLPAFSLQLNGYGGLMHTIDAFAYTGYTGASGYAYVNDATGFNATGVFTCTGLALNTGPVSNAVVAMKGTHTFYPPP